MKPSRLSLILFILAGVVAHAADTAAPTSAADPLADLPDGAQAASSAKPSDVAAKTSEAAPKTTPPAATSTPAAPAASATSTPTADAAKTSAPSTAPAAPPEEPKAAVKEEAKPEAPANAAKADDMPPDDLPASPPPATAPTPESKQVEPPSKFDAAADAATNSSVPPPTAKQAETPAVSTPSADTAAAAPPPATAPAPAPAEPKPEDLPPEIRALEQSLNAGTTLPKELYDPSEPGGALRPSERFARIPLRPPMSDANWRKWAGPMLEKTYKIHRRDTLWGVSERLFGTPYLWPKVWQLNAMISNPNVVDPGVELMFTPGNPNSAPMLAFKNYPGSSTDEIPLVTAVHKRSFLDMIDENLRAQILSSQPPFRDFLLDSSPAYIGKIPNPETAGRIFFVEGDSYPSDLDEGTYNIVKVHPVLGKGTDAYQVHWIGILDVHSKMAKIKKAFYEIAAGDLVVSKSFAIPPVALYEPMFDSVLRDQTQMVALQEGHENLTAENTLVGLIFPGSDVGPRAGAILPIVEGHRQVGTLLLLDRDKRMGTAWVVETKHELALMDVQEGLREAAAKSDAAKGASTSHSRRRSDDIAGFAGADLGFVSSGQTSLAWGLLGGGSTREFEFGLHVLHSSLQTNATATVASQTLSVWEFLPRAGYLIDLNRLSFSVGAELGYIMGSYSGGSSGAVAYGPYGTLNADLSPQWSAIFSLEWIMTSNTSAFQTMGGLIYHF